MSAFANRWGKRQGHPLSPVPVKAVLEVLARALRQDKETKASRLKVRSKTVFIHKWHDYPCKKSKKYYYLLMLLDKKPSTVTEQKVNNTECLDANNNHKK